MEFLVYELKADALHLGERPKGEIFKPCIKSSIPFTQISGALNHYFGNSNNEFKAVGIFDKGSHINKPEYMVYSPREKVVDISKVPLQIEILTNVQAKIYILKNESSKILSNLHNIFLGGFRTKGVGNCKIEKIDIIKNPKIEESKKKELAIRIPIEEINAFGIQKINNPVYGYLFKPFKDSPFSGEYILSYFEGSTGIESSPEFLLKEVR